jgi:hypothetical protein
MSDDSFEKVPPNPPWGFIAESGEFVELPWRPLKLAGFRQPPFDVVLPSKRTRRVVERPAGPAASIY